MQQLKYRNVEFEEEIGKKKTKQNANQQTFDIEIQKLKEEILKMTTSSQSVGACAASNVEHVKGKRNIQLEYYTGQPDEVIISQDNVVKFKSDCTTAVYATRDCCD